MISLPQLGVFERLLLSLSALIWPLQAAVITLQLPE
jgi:hypothetical protein